MFLSIVRSLFATLIVAGFLGSAEANARPAVDKAENQIRSADRQQLMKALAKFLYGIQHRVPELITSCYKPGFGAAPREPGDDGKTGSVAKDVAQFCRDFVGSGDKPIVYMFKPRIELSGKEAVVSCTLSWNVLDSRTKKADHFITRETFHLTKVNGKYIICEANVTPIVFRHLRDKEQFRREYAKLEMNGGLQ